MITVSYILVLRNETFIVHWDITFSLLLQQTEINFHLGGKIQQYFQCFHDLCDLGNPKAATFINWQKLVILTDLKQGIGDYS